MTAAVSPARRRLVFTTLGTALLAGCGFQLRQAPNFVFDAIVLNAAPGSPVANELRRNLLASGRVQILATPVAAVLAPPSTIADPAPLPTAPAVTVPNAVILDVLLEQREKVVVGLNSTGQVREFQLRSRLRFRLRTPQGRELIPDTELLQFRDISFNEGAVLAKEAEESLLYRDMQTDVVQQLLRRLAAVKSL